MAEAKAKFFTGSALSARGEKGRFVLPASFRKPAIEGSGGNLRMCLAWHPSKPCLIGYGTGRLDELDAQIDRDEQQALALGQRFDRETAEEQRYGYIEEIVLDASGRFTIPRSLEKLAKIGDKAFFQGHGRYFMLWNPDVLAHQGMDHVRAQKMLEVLLDDEGR